MDLTSAPGARRHVGPLVTAVAGALDHGAAGPTAPAAEAGSSGGVRSGSDTQQTARGKTMSPGFRVTRRQEVTAREGTMEAGTPPSWLRELEAALLTEALEDLLPQ